MSTNIRWLNGSIHTVEISSLPEHLSNTHMIANKLGALKTITLISLDEMVESGDNEKRFFVPGPLPQILPQVVGSIQITWSEKTNGGEQWGIFRGKPSHATSSGDIRVLCPELERLQFPSSREIVVAGAVIWYFTQAYPTEEETQVEAVPRRPSDSVLLCDTKCDDLTVELNLRGCRVAEHIPTSRSVPTLLE